MSVFAVSCFLFFKITSKWLCLKSLGINHIYISTIKCDHLFTDANAYLMAHFGPGITVIHLDDVTCTGTETSLLRCSYDIDTADCSHDQDAGVRCTPVRKFEKRDMIKIRTYICSQAYVSFLVIAAGLLAQTLELEHNWKMYTYIYSYYTMYWCVDKHC